MKKLLFVFLSFLWIASAQAQFADQRTYAGNTAGSANAQTVAISNYQLNPGVVIRFVASFTNTGPMTLNVNGAGVVPVERLYPAGLQALNGGEVVANQVSEVVFDGAQFELLGPVPVQQFSNQSTLASASTTSLVSAPTHTIYITGNATISSFGAPGNPTNPWYLLIFASNATITPSASIIYPETVTTNPNDTMLVYDNGTAWNILGYFSSVNQQLSGEIKTFAFANCPINWHVTDGAAVSRTTYANLFAAIGTTYGNGDGSTTFNLPDGRGEFVRVWDNGAGRDTGRALGSTQTNQVGAASGTITATTTVSAPTATSASTSSTPTATSTSTFSAGVTTPSVFESTGGTAGVAVSGTSQFAQAAVTGTVTTTTTVSTPTITTTTTVNAPTAGTTGTAATNAGNTDNRPINIAYQNCIKL